jgi:hypothetical protein
MGAPVNGRAPAQDARAERNGDRAGRAGGHRFGRGEATLRADEQGQAAVGQAALERDQRLADRQASLALPGQQRRVAAERAERLGQRAGLGQGW